MILIGLLVGAALALYAGSQQTRLPAPFGPARNGSMFFADTDGVIYSFDPATEARTAIVSGLIPTSIPCHPGTASGWHSILASTSSQALVADVDGSNIHALAGTYSDVQEMDWSPDDQQLAIISTVAGERSLTIAEADRDQAPRHCHSTVRSDHRPLPARWQAGFIGPPGARNELWRA